MQTKARVIALYLPQFHPISLNDEWWGKGFTEWTNVGKAKALFKGHQQPRVPADLGYYDLRMESVRQAQAEMARDSGVEGFMYWHYWFGNGFRLLEQPFNEVLATGKPDFPFCLGWANHSWATKTWITSKKHKDGMIAEQRYPGKDDIIEHFHAILPAFLDKRYMQVDGCPIFLIYEPFSVPNVQDFIQMWRDLAVKNGLKGIHFIGQETGWEKNIPKIVELGFDAVNYNGQWRAECLLKGKYWRTLKYNIIEKMGFGMLDTYEYSRISELLFSDYDRNEFVYPTIVPQWDRSPRGGNKAVIYVGSTPEKFQEQVERAIPLVEGKENDKKILILRSWNEWGEGNYMEPDLMFGHGYLNALRNAIVS